MQQLSLLPSSSSQQASSSGFSGGKSEQDSAGFTRAFGEAEKAYKPRETANSAPVDDTPSSQKAASIADSQKGSVSTVAKGDARSATPSNQSAAVADVAPEAVEGSESGNGLPEDSTSLPVANGSSLPAESEAGYASTKPPANGLSSIFQVQVDGDDLAQQEVMAGLAGLSPSMNTGQTPPKLNELFSEGPLSNAIAAIAASGAAAVDGAQGKGSGVTALQSPEGGWKIPAHPGLVSGESASGTSPAYQSLVDARNQEAFLKGSALGPTLNSGGSAATGQSTAAQAQNGQAGFNFSVNGMPQAVPQLSDTATAKLAELSSNGLPAGNALNSSVVEVKGQLENGVSAKGGEAAQAALLTGGPVSAPVKGNGTLGAQQAPNANESALSNLNEHAMNSANEMARFNRPVSGDASSPTMIATDSVNGLQSESELRFKAAMESVQTVRAGDVSDSADINPLKLDAASQLSKTAELKTSEPQTQNLGRPYVSSLGIPVDDAEWSNQLGQKLMWMNARNIQTAELHLNPADLGPIDVRIQVGADQSSISFNTQNQSVRELLEANIHRLREMLNSQSQTETGNSGGGTLAQDSGAQSKGQSSSDESFGQPSVGVSALDGVEGDEPHKIGSGENADRLVDAYV